MERDLREAAENEAHYDAGHRKFVTLQEEADHTEHDCNQDIEWILLIRIGADEARHHENRCQDIGSDCRHQSKRICQHSTHNEEE